MGIVEACEPKELLLEEDDENCNDRGVDWGDERLGGSSDDDEDEDDDGGVDRNETLEDASVHDADEADDADAGTDGHASDAEGGVSDAESALASLAEVGDAPVQELAQSDEGEADGEQEDEDHDEKEFPVAVPTALVAGA